MFPPPNHQQPTTHPKLLGYLQMDRNSSNMHSPWKIATHTGEDHSYLKHNVTWEAQISMEYYIIIMDPLLETMKEKLKRRNKKILTKHPTDIWLVLKVL